MQEKEEFFDQLNPDISEGIFDYHREFIYTTFEFECEARNMAIKIFRKKRKSGRNLNEFESSSDEEYDFEDSRCSSGNCKDHGNHQQFSQKKAQKTSSNDTMVISTTDDTLLKVQQALVQSRTTALASGK